MRPTAVTGFSGRGQIQETAVGHSPHGGDGVANKAVIGQGDMEGVNAGFLQPSCHNFSLFRLLVIW
jgi:hypothetical protein